MRTDKKNILYLFLLLPALMLFSETLFFGFMSDDFHLVHRVRAEGFFPSWGGEENNIYVRPVAVLSFFTDNMIWGKEAFGYHLTNVLWHLVCCILVFILGRELFKDREKALSAGFLFLLLACHSESVSWVSGRTDLIATAFSLASVVLFLRKSVWCLPVFLVAVAAKESALATPVVWLLFLLKPIALRRKDIVLVIAGLILAGVYLLFRTIYSTDFTGDFQTAGAGVSAVSALVNLFRYTFRVLLPPLPGSFRPFLERFPFFPPLFLAGLLAGAMYSLRGKNFDRKTMTVLLGSFFVLLLPVMFMSVSLFDSRSERFLYLPGVFAVLSLVQWSFTVFSRRTALVILVLFSLLQGAFLYRSNRNWKIAGEMCQSIVLRGRDERPENYNGAYVFRNGYEEAVLLLGE